MPASTDGSSSTCHTRPSHVRGRDTVWTCCRERMCMRPNLDMCTTHTLPSLSCVGCVVLGSQGHTWMRLVTSPTAQMEGTLVREYSSTITSPLGPSLTPASSSPRPRVLGLRPARYKDDSVAVISTKPGRTKGTAGGLPQWCTGLYTSSVCPEDLPCSWD